MPGPTNAQPDMKKKTDVATGEEKPELPRVWDELEKYRADYGLDYPWTWIGLSHLSRKDRLKRLMGRPATQRIVQHLASLPEGELRRLETLATVNMNRAQDALRTTLLVNLSSPIAVIVAVGQLFPREFQAFVADLRHQQVLGGYVVLLAVLVLLGVMHAWLRSRDAIELRDVVSIVLAGAVRRAEASRPTHKA
ncbi:MAG: hypothetical protein ACFB9M_12405 [Myxococcota bacterium]